MTCRRIVPPILSILALAALPSAAAGLRRPTGLAATPLSDRETALGWKDTNGAEVGYAIERRLPRRGRFTRVAITAPDATSFRDTGLLGGTRYRYRVRALGVRGVSPPSMPAGVTTFDTPDDASPPGTPANVIAVATSCHRINVTWDAAADGESGVRGYNVYRDGVLARFVPAPATSTADTDLVEGTTYSCTVAAIDNAGNESPESEVASATTPACPTTTSTPWGVRMGGAGYDDAKGVAFDSSGDVLVTGEAVGPIDLGGGVTCTDSIFVAKYSPTGAPLWARCTGGTRGGGGGRGIAVDAAGDVLVTGYFRGTVDFGGGPLASPDGFDVFLVKYTAAGTHLWSKRFGSPIVGALVTESGSGVAVDAGGNVFVTGMFEGTADFGGGPLTSAGQSDVFLAKYTAAGTHLWSRRFGGVYTDEGKGLAVDPGGNVLLTGTFYATADFGGGPLAGTAGEAFLAKFSPAGTHLWSQHFGGVLSDEGRAVAVDGSGNVVMAGVFQGTIDLGGGPLTSAGGSDAFLARYSPAGAHLWSRRFGGTSNFDAGNGVGVDDNGNVVLIGYFAGTVDFGAGPLTSAGSKDAFVARYSAAGAPLWSQRYGGTGIDSGDAVAVDGVGVAAVAGFFFTAADLGAGPLASAGSADMFLLHLAP